MTKEELEKELVASGHRIVENRLTDEELEEVERELDETVGIDDERMAELGMPYQAVARNVLKAAFA